MDHLFEVLVVNSHEYDNGSRHTEWLKFPTDNETVTNLFNELNLPNNAGTNRYSIIDIVADNDELREILKTSSDIDELNYLANRIMALDDIEQQVFYTVLEREEIKTVKDAINLTYNTECYSVFPDMYSWRDVGEHFLMDEAELSYSRFDQIYEYFDFESYGQDHAMNTNGQLLDGIYIEFDDIFFKELYSGKISDIHIDHIVTGHGRECYNDVVYDCKLEHSMELAVDIDQYMRANSSSYAARFSDIDRQRSHLSDCLMDMVTVQIKDMIKETDTDKGRKLIDMINEFETEYPDDIYMLFQVKNGPETRDYRFTSSAELERMGLKVDVKNYDLKYTRYLGDSMPEDIFKKFNSGKVADFDGRSMSVSDVLVFCTGNVQTAYYCDPYGFTQLPDFLWERENHLETAEKSTEQNYNMIDEQINNEPPKQDNISVLVVEPLQEPYVKEIPDSTEAMQKELGGEIKIKYPFAEEAAVIYSDKSKTSGLRPNRALYDAEGNVYDILAGKFIVAGRDGDKFTSLPPELKDKMRDRFKHPEVFARINGEIKPVKLKPSIKEKLDKLKKSCRTEPKPKREPPKHEL